MNTRVHKFVSLFQVRDLLLVAWIVALNAAHAERFTYSYDGGGRLTVVTASAGQIRYHYDSRGNLTNRVSLPSPPDTDGDFLADAWEMLHFNTLNRDGSGDFDGDGARDLEEFIADTDPASAASFLHMTSIDVPDNGGVSLSWSAVPGRSYKVLFKEDLNAQWQELPGTITAGGGTASAIDLAPRAKSRFYRIQVQP